MKKVKMVCKGCNSDDVFADASTNDREVFLKWNVEDQKWDGPIKNNTIFCCNVCEDECILETVEL